MGIRMNNKKNEFAMKRRQKTTNRGNENSPVTDNLLCDVKFLPFGGVLKAILLFVLVSTFLRDSP